MEKSNVAKIKKMLGAISENDDIENQRSHFVILNENFVPLVQNTEVYQKRYTSKSVQ